VIKLSAVFAAALIACLIESSEEAVTVLALGQGSAYRLAAACLGFAASVAIVVCVVVFAGPLIIPERAMKFVAGGVLLAIGTWFLIGASR
jgi:uncharacterized membrane protein